MANGNDVRRVAAFLRRGWDGIPPDEPGAQGVEALRALLAKAHPSGCGGMAVHRGCICGGGCVCRAPAACVGFSVLVDLADGFVREHGA